jgi:hypothetical protein
MIGMHRYTSGMDRSITDTATQGTDTPGMSGIGMLDTDMLGISDTDMQDTDMTGTTDTDILDTDTLFWFHDDQVSDCANLAFALYAFTKKDKSGISGVKVLMEKLSS